jgi:hypothetical protein
MRTITIELSSDGCAEALRKIEEYKKEIKPKLDEVCRRLAEIGRDEAISIVDQIRAAEGNVVERIEAVPIENGWKIVMSGEDVYFIEFGTGDGVEPHFDTTVPVAWGTWSAENDQILWNQGFWYYNKVRFEGTTAYMPMYYAEKAMRENVDRIVQEVFSEK